MTELAGVEKTQLECSTMKT